LFPPGTDLFITSEDDVDGFGGILELRVVRFVPLVVLFGFFIRQLILLATTGIAKFPSEVVAINCRLIGTWMPWVFFLQELFKLLLRCCLPASRRMIHSRDEVVWLALSRWTRIVPLALVGTIVICAPQVAVIAPREPLPHLFLLLGSVMHHVTKSCNSFWSVPPKISVDAWVGDAIVEAVDNVLLRDIHNGGTHVEEMACVGPEELVAFLFTLSKVMMSTCMGDRPLKVVNEDFLEPLLGVDRVVIEALQPCERCRVQSHREVDDLGDVGSSCNIVAIAEELVCYRIS
jgi:hypothetical protein